ncbi:DegT/DnrJ/EryC1/StrS family aminotransferase [soil metagenome]
MHIPLVDLKAQYAAHRDVIDAAIAGILENATFIGGRPVSDFEAAFTTMFDAPNFISCANGTDALYIVLKMMGIGAGDEVITTAHSWISTSEAVTQVGAETVFVDVDDYYTIDADAIEERITPRTRAVIAVHLCGQPAAMDRITEICRRHGLKLIEDCAQAHLATFNGQKVGTFGDAATFSFFPSKNLGAYGDGGGIIVRDAELATKVRMYANHGALKRHQHVMEGMNSRLDALQAAILSAKLPFLADWTRRRQEHARYYDGLLADIPGVAIPLVRPGASHVYHLYMVQVENRDEVRVKLAKDGVETAVHYPTALPLLPAYQRMGHSPTDFPAASRNQDRILSIPLYPELTQSEMEYVAARLGVACAETVAVAV